MSRDCPDWLLITMAVRMWLQRFLPIRILMTRADRHMAAGNRVEAIRVLAIAANRADPEACLRVAQAYLDGQGVPRNATEGMRWLERAARLDHVPAQALLSALLLRGLGAAPSAGTTSALFNDPARPAGHTPPPPGFSEALEWARRSADAGSADGRAVLAYILTQGPEELRNPDKAAELYRLAAEAGSTQGALGHALALAAKGAEGSVDAAAQKKILHWLESAAKGGLPTAQYMLGELHERGLAGSVDLTAAATAYQAAAALGHRNAQARYGLALMQGRGIPKDELAGESWLRRAAMAGDPEAAALVGDLYARGGTGQSPAGKGGALPPNFLEAAQWYRRAAEAGHGAAARALGLLYLTGSGVGRDAEEAATWFRIAAARGDTAAQADLGNLALRGGGTPDDLARTCEWFQTAAERGDATAAFNLGICLLEGVGTERDPPKAAHWLRRAAESVPNAQFWYGRMLTQGNGVRADAAEGLVWITKAAQAGLAEAQVLLGSMLVNGEGGPKDHATAQVWFAHAAASGHAGAMFALGALAGGGHDVPTDRELAQNWFRAAAEKGHAHARLMLGRYLARGLAGPADPMQARRWLEQARDQGIAEAEGDLAALPPAAPLDATG